MTAPLSSNPIEHNNFDVLRLCFAGTVCLVHASELSGFAALKWITTVLSSAVAVKAFFVISGFLIFMSFERSASLASYAYKRVRRIYPAYAVTIVLCTFGLFLFSSLAFGDYFSAQTARYLLANLAFLNFLQPSLPGVFETQAVTVVNGALWTLKIEVLFYALVPVLVLAVRRTSPARLLGFVYLLSIAYGLILTEAYTRTGHALYIELARQLPGQLCFFAAGAFFYYFLALFRQYRFYCLAAAALWLVGQKWHAMPLLNALLEPLSLAVMVIFCGLCLNLGKIKTKNDYSYGVYILHFPIIQCLIASGWFSGYPWLFLTSVVAVTGVGAYAMWHLVEKRFLERIKSGKPLASPQVISAKPQT